MMTSKKKIGALRDRYHQYYQHQQLQQQQLPPPCNSNAPVAADPDIENSHVRGADGSILVIHRVPLAVESGFPHLQSPPLLPHQSDDSNTISDQSDKQEEPISVSINPGTMVAGESSSTSTTPKQGLEAIQNTDDEEHEGYEGAFPLTNPVDDVIHLYEKFGQSLAILLLRSRLQISSLQTERQENKQLKVQNEQLLCQVTGVRGELKALTEIYEQAVLNEKKQTEEFRQEMLKWKSHYFDLNAELESTKRQLLEKQVIIEELDNKLVNACRCQGNGCGKENKDDKIARELEEDVRINLHKKEIERLNLLNYEQSRLINKLETQKKTDLHLQFKTGAKLNELEAANFKWQKEYSTVQENLEKLKEEKVEIEKKSKILTKKSKRLRIRMKNKFEKLRKDLLVGKTCWKIKQNLKNRERVKFQMEKVRKKKMQMRKLKSKNKKLNNKLELIMAEQADQYKKQASLNQMLEEKFNQNQDEDPHTEIDENGVLDTVTLSPEAVVAQQQNPEPSTSPGIMEDDNLFAEKFKILINLDNGQPETIVPNSVSAETSQMLSSTESNNESRAGDVKGQEDEDAINKLKISQVTSLSFADLCDDNDLEEEEDNNDDASSTSSFTESERGLGCGTSVIRFSQSAETIKQKLF